MCLIFPSVMPAGVRQDSNSSAAHSTQPTIRACWHAQDMSPGSDTTSWHWLAVTSRLHLTHAAPAQRTCVAKDKVQHVEVLALEHVPARHDAATHSSSYHMACTPGRLPAAHQEMNTACQHACGSHILIHREGTNGRTCQATAAAVHHDSLKICARTACQADAPQAAHLSLPLLPL
jgi:hypothetical protein